MTAITNLRKDRRVDLRGEHPDNPQATKVYRIFPGQTVDVPGFDAKRPFNRDLIEEGSIRVGGRVAKENTDDQKAALLATLTNAQTDFKQKKDIAEAAQKAVKDDPTDENKKAFDKG
jgi:hypothetical protein